MARYTGPRVRISRRFGVPIFGPSKYLERRNYGPGMHGPKSRRKHTDYGLGLIEKQKLRYYYGLLERQFRGVYERALRRRGRHSLCRNPAPRRRRVSKAPAAAVHPATSARAHQHRGSPPTVCPRSAARFIGRPPKTRRRQAA